jgi:hypothetical protein
MSFDCVEIDGEIIATCSDFVRQFQNNIYDSLIILSRYSGDGQFVDKQVYLPEVYLKSKVGYLSSQNVHLLSTGDDVCYIYPTYPYLNFLKTQKSIPMNGISDLNNVGFEKFNPEMEIDLDKYERAFPISINGLFSDGKNIYVTVLHLVFENNETFRTGILQKYDLEGNFIASIELGDYKENKIKYIGYAMQKDCFYLIKMDSQIGWTFEYVNYFNE